MRNHFIVMPILITVCMVISAFVPALPGLFISLDGALVSFVNNHLFSGLIGDFNLLQMTINGAVALAGLVLFYLAKTRAARYTCLFIATFFLYSFFRFTFYSGYDLDLTLANFLQLAFFTGSILVIAGLLKNKFYLAGDFKPDITLPES